MPGRLTDTYVAAVQHDLADLTGEERLVGVVRRPTGWFAASVDENLPALGPPPDLLDETKARQAELEADGASSAEAHDAAWDDVEFERRYREYLDSGAADGALDRVRGLLADGRDVALVCYENTDEKRCHRTVLRERLGE